MAFNLFKIFQDDKPIIQEGVKASKNEITYSTSPYYLPTQFKPYNPDILYRKKGNYDIYDEMREDDQIKSIMMTKKYLMLGNGYSIDIKDEEDTQQNEIKEFIEKALTECIDIDFNKSLLEILTCMDYGVSFSEIVWKLEDGQYKIKFVKTRAPHSFIIYQDDQGNIEKIGQRTSIKGEIPITDLTNMIIMPYQMEFDNWFGKSDLKSAYRPWWCKDFIIKAWNIYLDRFGMPLAVGKFDSATTTAADQAKLQQVLDHLQTKTSITIPKELEVEFLEASRTGTAGYLDALNSYNQQIARSMLMPDLMGMAGEKTGGGSYSLGQTQYDMFLKTLEWTRKELQRYIQRKIIDPLVKYNFAVEDIPQFHFKDMSETMKIESIKVWTELIKTGKHEPTPEEINWAKRIIGAPLTEYDDTMQAGITGKDGQELATPIDVEADAKAKLKGTVGGVQGILSIQQSVQAGTTPYESAVNILKEIYGFDDKTARAMLGDQKSIEEKNTKPIEQEVDAKGKPLEKEDDDIEDSKLPKNGKELPEEKTKDGKEKADEKKMAMGTMRAPIMAEKKQDFNKVNEDQLNTIELYSRQASATIATMQEVLLETIRKGRWIENKKLDKVAELELKYTDRLRMDIKAGMREMFNMGQRDAKFELKKDKGYIKTYATTDHISQYLRIEQLPFADFKEGTVSITDIDMNRGIYFSWGMLKDATKAVQSYLFMKGYGWDDAKAQEFVDKLKGIKKQEEVSKQDELDSYFGNIGIRLNELLEKTYAMDEEDVYDQVIKNAPMLASTSITDDIVKKVKITLNAGITQGLAQGEIIKQIKMIFEPYNYSIDGALLETTMRTNFATAYNQSKLAYFAPAVNSGDIFAYQYSAILDDRTTDICSDLNGKIFRADNISDIEPPLHYNCRSTLIPITKDEIENESIFGASEEENSTFFNDAGKFQESPKDLGGYEMRPGGFYQKK